MTAEPWVIVLAGGDGRRLAAVSHDMLERRPQDLRVVRVAPCGWSDLGTPARLQSFLVGDQPAA